MAFSRMGARKPANPMVGVVLFLIGAVFCIATGIMGLFFSTDSLEVFFDGGERSMHRYEGTVYASSPVFAQVDHSLNYIIPTGHEYYCLVLTDDLSQGVAVRVSKNWYDRNFTDGSSTAGVRIKGRVRALDSDVQGRLRSVLENLREDAPGFYCDGNVYIDVYGDILLVLRIVEGVLMLGFAIGLYALIKRGVDLGTGQQAFRSGAAGAATVAVGLVVSVLGIYLLSVG